MSWLSFVFILPDFCLQIRMERKDVSNENKKYNRMISTRARKFKFTQGEKVLCYEPDKSKARVLYDSKVVEIITKKDSKGKKSWEYLIHFQGWNSSWDRYVSEDHILKDTEENRQLQKDLAQKARLQQGGYLYHRERKRLQLGLASKTGESLEHRRSYRKREPEVLSDEETDEDEQEERDTNEEDEDAIRSSSSHHNEDITTGDEASEEEEEEEDDDDVPITTYDMGSTLMGYLHRDSAAINEQNKLVKIPADHNVVSILEAYMRECARNQLNGASEKPDRRSRHTSSNSETNDLETTCRRLKIIQEIVESLRISFNYLLSKQLLYKQEKQQFESFQNFVPPVKNFIPPVKNFIPHIKQEQVDSVGDDQNTIELCENTTEASPSSTSPSSCKRRYLQNSNEVVMVGRTLRSCRSPIDVGQSGNTDGRMEHFSMPVDVPVKEEDSASGSKTPKTYGSMSPSGNLDHNSQNLLNRILSWRLIPEEVQKECPSMPCFHYGAIHLTRLLLNLPDVLDQTDITNRNLNIIFKHLDAFCRYLEQHKEWFKDIYVDNVTVQNEETTAS